MRPQRGFTLVEMLVALAIFALLGAAAWQVLDGVIRSDERTAAHNAQLRQYNRAMAQLRQDLEQVVPRPVRGPAGVQRPWLAVGDATLPIELTRAGVANPLGLQRSGMQRVAYGVGLHPDYENADSPHYRQQGTYLLRYSWPVLDGASPESARIQVLLAEIEAIGVVVQGERGQHRQWPPKQSAPGGAAELPRLLDIELTHAQWGVLRHRIALL